MPNLAPDPVLTAADAAAYRDRVLDAVPADLRDGFVPLMTLYLKETTTAETITEAAKSGIVKACKLYPAGATTNSAHGVSNLSALHPALAAMEHHGLILCVHAEDPDPSVDFFDRERVFLRDKLPALLRPFPRL
eukprot:CAMPEP_0184718044 /NCGR_PEP_ID=MMETSP0314-20130426/7347_1 /TAXON_ID=38298 /ORGANISM="Rhodella maculata, Strain CCMP 736" /LENGTH=133 /DNA_ID=CAMNT_0027181715 /DNA_START=23 /DNA_END=420 /DNA_ORIENTATION=-